MDILQSDHNLPPDQRYSGPKPVDYKKTLTTEEINRLAADIRRRWAENAQPQRRG